MFIFILFNLIGVIEREIENFFFFFLVLKFRIVVLFFMFFNLLVIFE